LEKSLQTAAGADTGNSANSWKAFARLKILLQVTTLRAGGNRSSSICSN